MIRLTPIEIEIARTKLYKRYEKRQISIIEIDYVSYLEQYILRLKDEIDKLTKTTP